MSLCSFLPDLPPYKFKWHQPVANVDIMDGLYEGDYFIPVWSF